MAAVAAATNGQALCYCNTNAVSDGKQHATCRHMCVYTNTYIRACVENASACAAATRVRAKARRKLINHVWHSLRHRITLKLE